MFAKIAKCFNVKIVAKDFNEKIIKKNEEIIKKNFFAC